MKKIDWLNHLVAFTSSLLGILIAFQLDNWRESRGENEKMQIALQGIKKEIENNIKIYQTNSDTISLWIDYIDFDKNHFKDGIGTLASSKEFNKYASKDPERFSDFKLIKKYNDTLNIYKRNFLRLMQFPKTGISTDSWEAAKSSGVLNNLDHAKMTSLTRIYSWTKMDIGGEEEFYKTFVSNAFDIEVLGIQKVIASLRSTANVSKFKKEKIEKEFKLMNREIK